MVGGALIWTLIGGLPVALFIKALGKRPKLPLWPFPVAAILGAALTFARLET